jgi:hypothetical protein
MDGTLLNNFLIGADPEMVLLEPPTLINGQITARLPANTFYGWDHAGYVLEPHPTPSLSVREVVHNLRKSLHVVGHHFDRYKFRAGAYLHTPQRAVTLGGHVHLDIPRLTGAQILAMDQFAENLETLDILPSAECKERVRNGQYGRKSDIRAEHGHVEYRSMCSWLFSQKTSMLSMTGIKLCAIAPETVAAVTSYKALLKWLEGFKGKDDDVDWILTKEYLTNSGSMTAKPDNNIKAVWRINNEKGASLLKATVVAPLTADFPDPELRHFNRPAFIRRYMAANEVRPSAYALELAREQFDITERRRYVTALEEHRQRMAAQAAARAIEPLPPVEDLEETDDLDDEEDAE